MINNGPAATTFAVHPTIIGIRQCSTQSVTMKVSSKGYQHISIERIQVQRRKDLQQQQQKTANSAERNPRIDYAVVNQSRRLARFPPTPASQCQFGGRCTGNPREAVLVICRSVSSHCFCLGGSRNFWGIS